MALVTSKKNTRKIKIKAIEPGDYDKSTIHVFYAEFKIISQKKWQALLDDDDYTVSDSLREGLMGFEDVKDEAGDELPFNPELVDSLLEEPWIVTPLFKAQMAVQGGIQQSELYKRQKRKN